MTRRQARTRNAFWAGAGRNSRTAKLPPKWRLHGTTWHTVTYTSDAAHRPVVHLSTDGCEALSAVSNPCSLPFPLFSIFFYVFIFSLFFLWFSSVLPWFSLARLGRGRGVPRPPGCEGNRLKMCPVPTFDGKEIASDRLQIQFLYTLLVKHVIFLLLHLHEKISEENQ